MSFPPVPDPSDPLVELEPSGRVQADPMYWRAKFPGATPRVLVRAGLVPRLQEAAAALPDGVVLRIVDGWRTAELQRALFEWTKSRIGAEAARPFSFDQSSPEAYAAPQPPHRTGGAVDVMPIVLATGEPLPMGCGVDDVTALAGAFALDEEPYVANAEYDEARENRRLLREAMKAHGFAPYHVEWWHFDFGNQFWRVHSGLEQPSDAELYGVLDGPA